MCSYFEGDKALIWTWVHRVPLTQTALAVEHIHCGVLYPTPLFRQPAYVQAELSLPETERACAEVLCLPIHPAVTVGDVDRVCGEIIRWSRP